MSLRQSLADTVRAKSGTNISLTPTPAKSASVSATSGSPAVSTTVPQLSSGGTGLGMAKKSAVAGSAGMGGKNGVGFPKRASMASGPSGIKGPTKLGRNIRGSMK